MAWKTFWMEPTGRMRLGLRRYTDPGSDSWTCASGWHTGFRWTGDERELVLNAVGTAEFSWPAPPPDDPGWPTFCDKDCGYRFTDNDARQTWTERLWRRADTGELRVLHPIHAPEDAPTAEPGATWDAGWSDRKGADGISLMVRCPHRDGSPGLDWPVDWPSTGSGAMWERTGDPRLANVTARPSISIGGPGPAHYHGWLTDGVLSDTLD